MIKNILLIQPPYTIHKAEPKGCQPPLGLAYIAAVLAQEGYNVKIFDAIVEDFKYEISEGNKDILRYGADFENIREIIKEYSPDVVGISCLFSVQHKNALNIAKIVKEERPDSFVVMGGAHPSVAYNNILTNQFVDFVIIGEGEYSFKDLMKVLNNKDSFERVNGLVYKKDGQVKINPKTKYIQNLDELPFPARHLLPMEKYFEINRPHGTTSLKSPNTSIITSRGCPANCIFCSIHSVWGKSFRVRSPENVVQEIRHLKNMYGIKELQFEDDNLTFDKKRAKNIFNLMIEDKLGIHWTTPNGIAAYAIDDELIELMKRSGCYRICLAVESGDEYVLHKIIKKPLKLEKIKPLVKEFHKAEIAVDGFFVLGFPDETKAQMKKTFKFASQVGFDNVNFFMATPYPGTRLYDICKTKGYLSDFSYNKLKVGNANISTPNFSAKELERLIAKETLKFRIKQLKNPTIFYNRVIKRLLSEPRFFINYFKKLVLRMAGS